MLWSIDWLNFKFDVRFIYTFLFQSTFHRFIDDFYTKMLRFEKQIFILAPPTISLMNFAIVIVAYLESVQMNWMITNSKSNLLITCKTNRTLCVDCAQLTTCILVSAFIKVIIESPASPYVFVNAANQLIGIILSKH